MTEPRSSNAPTSADEGPPPPPAQRKGPGRFRRWLLRPLVWGGLLLLVAVSALYFFAESRLARERAVAFAKSRLFDVLGRNVQIGSVDFGFLPPTIEAHDVVIPGPTPQDPPVAKAAEIRVIVSLRKLRKRIVDLQQLEVIRPEIYLQINPDGSTNLPTFNFGEGGDGEARVDWRIGHLLVQDGVFRLDEKSVPFRLSAQGLWARMTGKGDRGGRGGSRLDVLATAQEVTLGLPDANPYNGTVSVKGSLSPKKRQVEIQAFRFAGPDLSASASGTIDYSTDQVAIDLPFQGQGEAAVVNRLGYMADPIKGSFRADGRFEMAKGEWKYSGTAGSQHVEVLHRTFEVVDAGFAGNHTGVSVDLKRASHAGGQVKGKVRVDTQDDGKAGVPVSLDLAFDGLALETLVADQFPGEPIPVVGGLTGRTTGTFKYAFRSTTPESGSGGGQIRLAGTSDRGLPLTGSFPLQLKQGVLSADGVQLTAPGQVVSNGRFVFDLPHGTGKVDLKLASSDLSPLRTLLEESPPPKEPTFWLPSQGRGTAEVSIALAPGSTNTRVILDLNSVVAPALRADTVRGALTISDQALEDLRLEIAQGDGAILVSGRVPLAAPGKGKAAQPLSLAVEASQWPASNLGYFLALFLPPDLARGASGEVSGRLDLGGTPDRLTGVLDTEIHDLVVAGIALGPTHASLKFDANDVVIEEATIHPGAGTIAVRGSMRGPSKTLDFTVDGPNLTLAGEPLRGWLGGDFGGRVALAAAASGTLDHPRVTASVQGRSLTFRGVAIDQEQETELMAEWDGERVSLDGKLLGLARVHGGGRLNQQGAGMTFDVASDRLYDLVRLITPQPPPQFSGALSGTVALDADFQDRDFRAVVRLADLTLTYLDRTAKNLEPVVVEIDPKQVRLESVYLGTPAGEGGTRDEIAINGTIGLGSEKSPLDLRVQSTVSATWLDLFVHNVTARGTLDLLSTVRGTVSSPVLNGTGDLHDASLVLKNRDFPQKLDEVKAFLSFNRDQIKLYELSARVGGGTLTGSGDLQLPAAGRPLNYKLTLNAKDLSLVYPEGLRNRADATITLASTESGRRVGGNVTIQQALYVDDMKIDILSLLQNALRRQRVEIAETDSFLATTELQVRILGDPLEHALRVRNNVADLRGDIKLTLGGTLASPTIGGTIEMLPGGTLTLLDNTYEIDRANITFNNAQRINPAIDLVAHTEVRNFNITVTIDGTLDKPTTNFSSDSELANLEILSLIATGDSSTFDANSFGSAASSDPNQKSGAGQLAQSFLAGQAFSQVSKRVGTLFGLDRFRISPIADTGQAFSDVGVTVGKRLSKDVFVTYTSDATGNRHHIFQVEWQVKKDLLIVLTQTESNKFSVDAQWEKRF